MPEIAEVARVVHFLRLHLVGKTIKKVDAPEDAIIFGKVGTTGPEVVAALTGKKVVSAGSQGKYFWLELDRAPHPVMHLGMTGWIHIKGQRTAYTNYYKKTKEGDADQWPPKFWKFCLETKDPAVKVAFTDPRRLGRVRLVDCPGKDIRQHSPLVENGPDPVVDLDRFTEEYLRKKMKARHVPIKALLLDQTTLSGIGNWVGDEVLYQAKLHPEQYCNEFNDEQIKKLFEAIRYVCQVSVDKLGDSDQFPKDWMFHYRWNNRPSAPTSHLPNGEKLAFLKVGGRTSCYAPNVQKKSGHIAPGVKEEPIVSDAEPETTTTKKKTTTKSKAKQEVKSEDNEDEQPRKKKMKTEKPLSKKVQTTETKAPKKQVAVPEPDIGGDRRRSGRLGGRSG